MDIIHQDAFYVRFRYIANSYGLLKVRCEREEDIHNFIATFLKIGQTTILLEYLLIDREQELNINI